MRWLRTSKAWFQLNRWSDAFFAFRDGGLAAFRLVLKEFASFVPASRPARRRFCRLSLESLEGRVVPNAAPFAMADSYAVQHDGSLWVPSPGVLGNDSDPDNDWLTAQLMSGASNGSLYFGGDGSLTYYPNPGFVGADSFTYRVNDGLADSNVATVIINVTNAAPTANADAFSVNENQTLWFWPTDLLANDSDADGDYLQFTGYTSTSHGTLITYPNGSLGYTPNANFAGQDTFTYNVFDGVQMTSGTVTITVNNIHLETSGSAFAALREVNSTIVVGAFTPEPGTLPSDYQAIINWGDGQLSTGTIDAAFHVSGNHVYHAQDAYAVAFQVISNVDQSTGVGLSYGQVESLTVDTRFQHVPSFGLAQSRTISQTGSTGNGIYTLTQTGTLHFTLDKTVNELYGRTTSHAVHVVTFLLQASGNDALGSFTLGDYTINAIGNATTSINDFRNDNDQFTSTSGSASDAYAHQGSGNGVSASFNKSFADNRSQNMAGGGNQGIGHFTINTTEASTTSRETWGNYANYINITQTESANATALKNGVDLSGSYAETVVSDSSAFLWETELYSANSYNVSQYGSENWTLNRAVTTAAGASNVTGSGSSSFNIAASNAPNFQSTTSLWHLSNLQATGNSLTNTYTSTNDRIYSSSTSLAATGPTSYGLSISSLDSSSTVLSEANQGWFESRSSYQLLSSTTNETGDIATGEVTRSASVSTNVNSASSSTDLTETITMVSDGSTLESQTTNFNIFSGAYATSVGGSSSDWVSYGYSNQFATNGNLTVTSESHTGSRTGNNIFGDYTEANHSTGSTTILDAYVNQSETENVVSVSTTVHAGTGIGNDVTGIYAESSNDTISTTANSTYTNIPEIDVSTTLTSETRSITSNGNFLTGAYSESSTNLVATTTDSTYTNQDESNTTTRSSNGTHTSTIIGNHFTGIYTETSNESVTITIADAYLNQTESNVSSSVSTRTNSSTSTGNATTGVYTTASTATDATTMTATYLNQGESNVSTSISTGTYISSVTGNDRTGVYSETSNESYTTTVTSTNNRQGVLTNNSSTTTVTGTSTSSGNEITGVYSSSSLDSSYTTIQSAYTNQLETDFSTTAINDARTMTSAGNSITGVYSSTSTATITTTITDAYTNQTESSNSTVFTISNSTATIDGNSIDGTYTSNSTENLNTTVNNTYSNQAQIDVTTTTTTALRTESTTGDENSGAYSSSSNVISTTSETLTHVNQTENVVSTTISNDTLTTTISGDDVTGTFSSVEIYASSRTVNASGVDARGNFVLAEAITETGTTTDFGQTITGVHYPISNTSLIVVGSKSGGDGLTTYSQTYTETVTTNAQLTADNEVTGAFVENTTIFSSYDLEETGSYQTTTYLLTEFSTADTTIVRTGNDLTGAESSTTTHNNVSTIQEIGADANGGNYTLLKNATTSQSENYSANNVTGAYASTGTFTTNSTAEESTNNPAGVTAFTETIVEAFATSEVGNFITGAYTRTFGRTKTMSDIDAGALNGETFSVSESSSESAAGAEIGNTITSDYARNENVTTTYSMTEIGPDFTLDTSGTWSATVTETGNTLQGSYAIVMLGTDAFSMNETGLLPGGSFDQTVTGVETFEFNESGNAANQTFQRSIIGSAGYTDVTSITINGPANTVTTTDDYSYQIQEDASARAGAFNQTGGLGRYELLIRFIDVSNTTAGNQPGHLNFLPFGQPFVDADPVSHIDSSYGLTQRRARKRM